jgi:hypothetical protein
MLGGRLVVEASRALTESAATEERLEAHAHAVLAGVPANAPTGRYDR